MCFPADKQGHRENFEWTEEMDGLVFKPHFSKVPKPNAVIDKMGYLAMVNEVVSRLQKGEAEKVVLSRIKSVELPKNFNLDNLYQKLTRAYPNCLVSLISLEDGSHWIGATPEVLLKKRGGAFEIMSLAGSQKSTGISLDQYQWGSKEEREQNTVTDFIVQSLTSAGATDIVKGQPYTYEAGPVVHRRTDLRFSFSGPMESLLNALHPTPAVGGFPKQKAQEMIDEMEPHSRMYYTGIIGLIHDNGDADLYVNLRCMRISNNVAHLYVGGGIMPDSDAEKEWEETELKSETLLRFLNEHQG